MKDFLENIIKNIVEQPEEVSVTETEAKGRIVLTIKVADGDMGRVIGKDGKVINAIRMVMRVMAIRQDARIRIDIEDNNPPQQQTESPAAPAPAPQQAPEVPAQPPVQQPPVQPAAAAPAQPSPADFVGQQPPVQQPQVQPAAPAPQQTPAGTTVLDNSNN